MHNQFMQAALEQAYLGRGACAPNPSVGAVAVHDQQIIARAWHRGAGTAHAEQQILELLPQGISNVTLYVTLEPCNHWGKTPPCVASIINSSIQRVVYSFRDPNPIVIANNTPRILNKQGIEVIHYPLADIDAFYQSYQFWTNTKKPWITAKIAQTLDGKIAGMYGQKQQLSNTNCAKFTHKQRLYTDAILTSAKTIINDDPALDVRLDGLKQKKTIAIIDTQLSLPKNATIFMTTQHCHIYHDNHIMVKTPIANCSYHGIPTINGRLNLMAVIDHLGTLGFHDVWVEVGGHLFSAFHQQGLVNRTYLYIVPMVLGDKAIPAYHGTEVFSRCHRISWQIEADNMIACLEW